MRVIIAGSRDGFTEDSVHAFLTLIAVPFFDDFVNSRGITEVVCGMARGVDLFGKSWAENHDIPVKKFPADWDNLGKAAGPIRNQQMAEYADALVAFRINNSRGTSDMIERAETMGLHILSLNKMVTHGKGF